MKFLIITHAVHKYSNGKYYAYAPYVREMNLWLKQVEQVIIAAPLANEMAPTPIEIHYDHRKITFVKLRAFNFTSLANCVASLAIIPLNFVLILKAISQSDHIHLRCPGNVGLLGAIAQIFFPRKKKTAKYAGNWTNYNGQPVSYSIQKKILSDTFLTRNMRVLAYGNWPDLSSNVVPFFTATYSEREVDPLQLRDLNGTCEFVFVGTLTPNKNPLIAIRLIQLLRQKIDVLVHFAGDGPAREALEDYADAHGMSDITVFHGNISADRVKQLYKQAHFCILLSNSEGWPKAVAEAMFWGCIPVATRVSCVPWMLDFGKRGILVEKDNLEEGSRDILNIVNNPTKFREISMKAAEWSREFTLEKFEAGIQQFIAAQ